MQQRSRRGRNVHTLTRKQSEEVCSRFYFRKPPASHSWGLQSHNVKRRKGGENSNRIWILIPQRPRTFRNEPRERRGLRGAAAKSHTNKPPNKPKTLTVHIIRGRKGGGGGPQQAHDAGGRRSKPPESACVKAGSHFARGTARKPRCTDLEEGGASLRSQRVCKRALQALAG